MPTLNEDTFNVCSVSAAPYTTLSQQQDIQIFTMSMKDIDRELTLNRECQTEEISLSAAKNTNQHLEDVCQKLLTEFHDFLNVFDCTQISKLPPHHSYDHKIELTDNVTPS